MGEQSVAEIVKFFERQGASPESLLSSEQMHLCLCVGGEYDRGVYNQLWEQIRVLGRDSQGNSLSNVYEWV